MFVLLLVQGVPSAFLCGLSVRYALSFSPPTGPSTKWSSILNGNYTVLDHFLHHAETVVIDGSSFRMKNRIET